MTPEDHFAIGVLCGICVAVGFLFGRWIPCRHDWQDGGVVSITDGPDAMPHKYFMRQRCTKCGKWRRQRY